MGQVLVHNVPVNRLKAAAAKVGYEATDAGVEAWARDWMRDSVRGIEQNDALAAAKLPDNDPDFGPSKTARDAKQAEDEARAAEGKPARRAKRGR